MNNYVEEVKIADEPCNCERSCIPSDTIRYEFFRKTYHRGLKIVPQIVVFIQQDENRVRLDKCQIESLVRMVNERQEKLDKP